MREKILTTVKSFGVNYPIVVKETDVGCEIRLANGQDSFNIVDDGFEYTVFADEWYEHCPTVEDLRQLLADLFTGGAHVVVKYRGTHVVGHQLQVVDGESVGVAHLSHFVFSPFWRKKSYATIRYTGAVKNVLLA